MARTGRKITMPNDVRRDLAHPDGPVHWYASELDADDAVTLLCYLFGDGYTRRAPELDGACGYATRDSRVT